MSEKTTHKPTVKKKKSKIFSIGIITPFSEGVDSALVLKLIEPICELDFHMSVLALGDEEPQKTCFEFAEKYPDNLEVLESVPRNKEKILAESQVVLFMEAPNKKMLELVSKNGLIALIPKNNKDSDLVDFDSLKEVGNCFIYDNKNFWKFLSTLLRAYETFKFPYDWNNCKKNLKQTLEG